MKHAATIIGTNSGWPPNWWEYQDAPSRKCRRLAKRPLSGYKCLVKSALRVASPPAKPLMIYDGECNFCVLWMRRLQHSSGEHLDFLPFQDPRLAVEFPELSREQSETAVQLIEADGEVYSAAEALFRALAHNPRHQWLFDWYESSPAFGDRKSTRL